MIWILMSNLNGSVKHIKKANWISEMTKDLERFRMVLRDRTGVENKLTDIPKSHGCRLRNHIQACQASHVLQLCLQLEKLSEPEHHYSEGKEIN